MNDESLRIIPEDLWNKVQELLQKRRSHRPGRRGKYPLSGRLVCGKCGASMIIQSSGLIRPGFVCNNYWSKVKSVCDCKQRLPQQETEDKLFSEIPKIVFAEDMLSELMDRVEKQVAEFCNYNSDDVKRLMAREAQLKKAVDNLLNLAEAGHISSDALSERLARNESKLSRVRRELSSLSGNGRKDFKFKREMVMERLSKIPELVRSGRANVRETQAVLRKLYPEKLRVYARKLEGITVFRITGKAMPFKFVDEGNSPILVSGGEGNRTINGIWIPTEFEVIPKARAA